MTITSRTAYEKEYIFKFDSNQLSMKRIQSTKFLIMLICMLPYTIIDMVTQRADLWYIWMDNLVSIPASVFAILYFVNESIRKYSGSLLIATSIGILLYTGIYSYMSPGWPMYSATMALWASYFVLYETKWRMGKFIILPYLALICIYNTWFQVELTESARWLLPSFQFSRIGVAIFFVMSIGAILHLTLVYEKFSIENLQLKDSKISFQNDLFSILAHNIRTPLATLTMQYELAELRKNASVSLAKTQLPLKQLELTINAMLDNRKALKSENVLSLGDVLEELKNLHGNLQIVGDFESEHGIEYGVVMGLDCFISNALKFDKQPILRVIDGETLTFQLEDKGGGMDAIDFKEYGNPVVSKSRGLGIGVHLSKEILSHLGYTCEVGNTKHIGLTIRLYKPTAQPKKALDHTHFKVLC